MPPQLPAILLIEKDEITLELYQRELSKSFTVLAFTNLNGVLKALSTADISAVIIEPEICAGEGWKMIDVIQAAPSVRHVPVIVCSTRDECSQNRGKNFSSYLTKPVLPRTLREKALEVIKIKT